MSRIISRYLNALLVALVLLGLAPALPRLAPTVAAAPPADRPLVISEFRVRGPNGANDEFIEITNVGSTSHIVAGGGTGYALAASDGVARFIIPNGTAIPAGGHYLGVNSVGYSLASYPAGNGTTATGDATYTTDIPDNGGIALFSTSVAVDFTLPNRLDAVGSTIEANTLYKEGTGYPALTPFSIDYAFHRNECGNSATSAGNVQYFPCPSGGLLADADNNAADFIFVDTNGTSAGAGQRLGAPGPQNLAAPLNACIAGATGLAIAPLDPTVGTFVAPNLVRDFTSDPANNSTFGTLDVRRTVTNTTGADLTRLRFRFTDITTFPAASGIADLRPRTSTAVVVTTSGGTVTVQGTTLEQPPSQPNGGGFNSSLAAGTITLATPLADGASVEVRFLLGIQQTGDIKLSLQAEALPNGVCAESRIVGGTDGFAFDVTDPVGTPQSTQLNTTFTTPLSVTVRGSGVAPSNTVANAAVLFTAPSSGASGTFAAPGTGNTAIVITDANGVATAPAFTANGTGGTYNVTARVIDSGTALDDASATATFTLTNVGPIANADNYVTNQGTPLIIAAPGVLANDTDDNGEPLSAAVDTAPGNGTLALNTDGSFTYTPNGGFSGNDAFTYTATDGTTISSPATVTIGVAAVNTTPVANGDNYAALEDTALVVVAPGVLGNDTDAESNPLTAVLVAGPVHGTLALDPNGAFSYTPTANYNGPDSFTYKANDGQGDSNVATVTLTVAAQNDPPTATADAYGLPKNGSLAIAAPGVLANDADIDGDPLAAILVGGPSNGTLVLSPNGAFTYTPNAGFIGFDQFAYRASDGIAQSAPVTVTIQVGDTATLSTAITGQGTLGVAPSPGPYVLGTVVTLTPQAASGYIFVGWVVDSVQAGWVPSLTITMDRDHAVTARFATVSDFSDLSTGNPAYLPVRELAARGIVRGYEDGRFGTADPLLRAQAAALVTRALDWDFENWGNPFTDQGAVDDNLWRNVGTLNHYGVARGFGDGTYQPTATVTHAQFISLVTRGMVAKGYWVMQPDDADRFPSVGASGHRQDLLTYQHYVGSFPELNEGSSAAAWFGPANRSWTARALWAAIDQYQRSDRTP